MTETKSQLELLREAYLPEDSLEELKKVEGDFEDVESSKDKQRRRNSYPFLSNCAGKYVLTIKNYFYGKPENKNSKWVKIFSMDCLIEEAIEDDAVNDVVIEQLEQRNDYRRNQFEEKKMADPKKYKNASFQAQTLSPYPKGQMVTHWLGREGAGGDFKQDVRNIVASVLGVSDSSVDAEDCEKVMILPEYLKNKKIVAYVNFRDYLNDKDQVRLAQNIIFYPTKGNKFQFSCLEEKEQPIQENEKIEEIAGF